MSSGVGVAREGEEAPPADGSTPGKRRWADGFPVRPSSFPPRTTDTAYVNLCSPGTATGATGSGPNSYDGGFRFSCEFIAWSHVIVLPVYADWRAMMAIRVALVM